MNCTELEHEWLDHDLNESAEAAVWSPAAERHFAECAACRRLRAGHALLKHAVAAWKAQPAPRVSTEQLLAAIWSDQRQASAGWTVAGSPDRVHPSASVRPKRRSAAESRIGSWTTVAAAVVLAVLGAGLYSLPERGEIRMADRTAQPTSLAPEASSAPVTATMALLWRDVQTNSAAAARTTVASLDHFPVVPLPSVAGDAMHGDAAAVERGNTTAESERRWQDWGAPLGHQVGNAFSFLGNALPNDPPPAS
ncbi:MAG: hypothetical protein SFV23_00225 [Planctomycetaceae bacterium]|nr:hypothetical protein [Planctomycetaceae bacterium]